MQIIDKIVSPVDKLIFADLLTMLFNEGCREPGNIHLLTGFRFAKRSDEPLKNGSHLHGKIHPARRWMFPGKTRIRTTK